MEILLFGKWDTKDVVVNDPGLRKYINLEPVIIPKTFGRYCTRSIDKIKINVVERFINKLYVSGHSGKRHRMSSGKHTGTYETLIKHVTKAFEIIEKRTKKNPIQILVKAIENAALYEEVVGYRVGGIIARKAVITSPRRRLDIALRLITQNIKKKTYNKKKKLFEVIAEQLLEIANNDARNNVIRERMRIEKEAEGAR